MKKHIDLVLQKSPQLIIVAEGAPSKKTPVIIEKVQSKKIKTIYMIYSKINLYIPI